MSIQWGAQAPHPTGGTAMHVLLGVTQHFRTRWPEWCLALVLVVQSSWLLWGRAIAPPAPPSKAYKVLFDMASTHSLATAGAVIGAGWVVALALNGTFLRFRRISPWCRVVTGTAASCYWTMWAVTAYQGNVYVFSNAWVNHLGYAIMAAICVLMSAQEVKHADQKAAQWHRIRQRTGGR